MRAKCRAVAVVTALACSVLLSLQIQSCNKMPCRGLATEYFYENEIALNKLVKLVQDHSEYDTIYLHGEDDVWVRVPGNYIEKKLEDEQLRKKLSKLMAEARAPMIINGKGVILFPGETEAKNERIFNVALAYIVNEKVVIETCESNAPESLTGECSIPLSGNWVISYFWVPEKECDTQILDLVRWLRNLREHNREAADGISGAFNDVADTDSDLPIVKGYRRIEVRESKFHCTEGLYYFDYDPSEDHASKIMKMTAECLESAKRNAEGRVEPSESQEPNLYTQNVFNLYIHPKLGWRQFTQTIEGIVRAGVSDVHFVLNSNVTYVQKPPDNPVMRRLDELRREAEKDLKPNESYILYPEAGAELFKDCPEIIEIYKKLFGRDMNERIYFLIKDLPSVIRKCGCVPPVEQIKSLIWQHDWWGYIRVGVHATLVLPKTKGCVEVSQPADMPWSEAHKVVVKAVESNPGKPLCFALTKQTSKKAGKDMEEEVKLGNAEYESRCKGYTDKQIEANVKDFVETVFGKKELTLADYYRLIGEGADIESEFEFRVCYEKKGLKYPPQEGERILDECRQFSYDRAHKPDSVPSYYLSAIRERFKLDPKKLKIHKVKRLGRGKDVPKSIVVVTSFGKTKVEFYHRVDDCHPPLLVTIHSYNGKAVLEKRGELVLEDTR